jgi:hypothetical protein
MEPFLMTNPASGSQMSRAGIGKYWTFEKLGAAMPEKKKKMARQHAVLK